MSSSSSLGRVSRASVHRSSSVANPFGWADVRPMLANRDPGVATDRADGRGSTTSPTVVRRALFTRRKWRVRWRT